MGPGGSRGLAAKEGLWLPGVQAQACVGRTVWQRGILLALSRVRGRETGRLGGGGVGVGGTATLRLAALVVPWAGETKMGTGGRACVFSQQSTEIFFFVFFLLWRMDDAGF